MGRFRFLPHVTSQKRYIKTLMCYFRCYVCGCGRLGIPGLLRRSPTPQSYVGSAGSSAASSETESPADTTRVDGYEYFIIYNASIIINY